MLGVFPVYNPPSRLSIPLKISCRPCLSADISSLPILRQTLYVLPVVSLFLLTVLFTRYRSQPVLVTSRELLVFDHEHTCKGRHRGEARVHDEQRAEAMRVPVEDRDGHRVRDAETGKLTRGRCGEAGPEYNGVVDNRFDGGSGEAEASHGRAQ